MYVLIAICSLISDCFVVLSFFSSSIPFDAAAFIVVCLACFLCIYYRALPYGYHEAHIKQFITAYFKLIAT